MAEPAPADEHTVREPTAEEINESVRRAQRALDEITARDAADQARLDAERAEELARWHAHDSTQHDSSSTDRAARGDEAPDQDTPPAVEMAVDDG
jgi:hypothetical protein